MGVEDVDQDDDYYCRPAPSNLGSFFPSGARDSFDISADAGGGDDQMGEAPRTLQSKQAQRPWGGLGS